MTDQQKQKAEAFLLLHQGPDTLVLPNAWDVASARIFEQASFPAIGTTSYAIAASLGYLDGEQIPFAEMIEVIGRIVKSTDLPVSADIEAGYGAGIAEVVETVRRVIEAGAAGINIEDATGNPEQPLFDAGFHCEKLQAVRETAASAGIPLVINARTDTYLIPFSDPDAQFHETVQRANAYRQAGADCIFIPGRLDGEMISRLVAAIAAPINIFATPVTPSVPELKKLGVARLSIGPGAFRTALACTRKIAAELAAHGTYGALFGETLTKAEVDSLLKPGSGGLRKQ
jgi:2-methylisocitrate lyase-like PEP mutase family enzyme